jgi:hypothetical protein
MAMPSAMRPTPPPPSANSAESTPLQRFVDDELMRAPLLFEQVLDGTLDALRKAMRMAAPGTLQVLLDLLQAVRAGRDRMSETFQRSLRQQMQQDLGRLGMTAHGAMLTHQTTPTSLSLVDEDEVSIDVELARTIQLIRDDTEYELHELRSFVTALAGDMHLPGETNPVRPEVFTRAWWTAAQTLPLSRRHQVTFLHHAAESLRQSLRLAYAAASSRLEELGVEPVSYRTMLRPGGLHRSRGLHTTYSPDLHGMRDRMIGMTLSPTASMRPEALQPAPPPAAWTPFPVLPTPPGPPDPDRSHAAASSADPARRSNDVRSSGVVRGLTPGRAPPGIPPAAQPAAPLPWREVAKAAITPLEKQSVELVSRLFDGMLTDERVPLDMRALLRRLHAPALRLALRDPTLVDDDKHPLWAFVHRLAYEAEMVPEATDPERGRLLKLGQAMIDRLAAEPDPHTGLFRWACEHLHDLLAQRLARRIALLASQIGTLQKLEDRLCSGVAPVSTLAGALDTPHLDTVPAELMGNPTNHAPLAGENPDAGEHWLATLQSGLWVRMFIDGRWVRAQLLWPGERREVWLFGDGASDCSWAVRRRALLAMRANGLIKLLRQRSLLRGAASRLQQQLQRTVGS